MVVGVQENSIHKLVHCIFTHFFSEREFLVLCSTPMPLILSLYLLLSLFLCLWLGVNSLLLFRWTSMWIVLFSLFIPFLYLHQFHWTIVNVTTLKTLRTQSNISSHRHTHRTLIWNSFHNHKWERYVYEYKNRRKIKRKTYSFDV